jgi:hypothetical protein
VVSAERGTGNKLVAHRTSISTPGVARLRRRVGIQVAQSILGSREEHFEHGRIPEQIRVMTQRSIEDATFTFLADPGDRVVAVFARAPPVAPALLLVDGGGINGQQNS